MMITEYKGITIDSVTFKDQIVLLQNEKMVAFEVKDANEIIEMIKAHAIVYKVMKEKK